jgi:Rieske Fe-S protein
MMASRREFIKKTCILCTGLGSSTFVLSGCQTTYYTAGTFMDTDLVIPITEFTYEKNNQLLKRLYIIVQNEKLEFPIYLYRFSDTEYSALWMKCSHRGAELQASGDHLYCSSHGSEFNNLGNVNQGPAEKNLRTFPVSVHGDSILINLRPS